MPRSDRRRALPGLRALVPLLALALTVSSARPVDAGTLEAIRERDHLVCGVTEGVPGFSSVDKAGTWAGMDVDFCKALAAAVLGRKDAVKYRALTPVNRFQVLASGEVDIIPRATSWTLSRDTDLGLRYAGTLFHDGQGFIVRRGFAVASVLELSGSSVCVMSGTNADESLAAYFRARQMRYQIVVSERWPDVVKAYADGGCTLLTGDLSVLAFERSRLAEPADHMILPELIAKDPTGPVVRQGDEAWFSVVRWTLDALVAAEELGLASGNVEDLLDTASSKPVRRFLGLEGNLGEPMGLSASWSYEVVRQVGNYAELFDRNVGAGSPLKLDRGVNNLWTKGGLMYALPIR